MSKGRTAASLDERVVRMPDSYQVNSRRVTTPNLATRASQGLPQDGLVFCSFNSTYKITQPVFEVWMRLLQAHPGSVLWQLADNDAALATLRREAQARGVASDRLVFAERVEQAEHLARQELADLFLDTCPVNAHTTASDAPWAGLPVLTCQGPAFIGKVADLAWSEKADAKETARAKVTVCTGLMGGAGKNVEVVLLRADRRFRLVLAKGDEALFIIRKHPTRKDAYLLAPHVGLVRAASENNANASAPLPTLRRMVPATQRVTSRRMNWMMDSIMEVWG